MLTDDEDTYQQILHSDINDASFCYSFDSDDKEDDDDDNLFQMDDVPCSSTTTRNNQQEDQPTIDMQVRYYTPTNEPPHGLSQSVVANDTDYLRRNVMNLRTKSIMVMDQEKDAPLEDILEENNDQNCQQQDQNQDTSQHLLIPTLLSSNIREKNNVYSQSAPSAPSILSSLPEFLRSIYHHTTLENNNEQVSDNEEETPREENSTIDSPIIIIDDDDNSDVQTVVKLDDNDEIVTNKEVSSSSTAKEEEGKTTTSVIISQPPPPTTNDSSIKEQQQKAEPQHVEQQRTTVTKPKTVKQKQEIIKPQNVEQQQQEKQKAVVLGNTQSPHENRQHKNKRRDDNASFRSWSKLASRRYREDGRIYFQRRQWLFSQTDSVSREKSRLWKDMHTIQNYEHFKKNPFIAQCIMRHAFSIKVTSISLLARYKDIERHFFSPHVVFIRFVRLFNCAYVAYRNYDEMIRAVSIFDKTAICGKTIYCRQSFYGELDKDDEMNTRILFSQSKYKKRHIIPRHYNPEAHDTFVPEHHGIIQKSMYSVVSTRNNSSKHHHTAAENQKKKVPTTVYLNRHHNYVLNRIILNNPINMYSPYHYVILKPWTQEDVEFSQMSQYWSFNQKVGASLNRLFKMTPYVVFIFSLRNSKSYQGYAIMNSEIEDLSYLSEQDLIGTPFFQLGEKYKTCGYGRHWRYSCKIEWVAIQSKSIHKTGSLLNPWCKNTPIRYSKDCTIVEPSLGHRIIKEFSL